MFVINSDQEKYHLLNMCNLCRYAQFLQAQSYITIIIGASMNLVNPYKFVEATKKTAMFTCLHKE